jgi:hypothetical protein
MFMDSGQQLTISPAQPPTGLIGRTAAHVRQLLCGLHGHDALLHFEQSRISLQCTSCGYETPGWDLKLEPAREEPSAAAPRVVRLPFLGERRVA